MALNLPNFAGLGTIDMLSQFLKGQNASTAPQQIAQQMEGNELSNALQKTQLKYAEPMAEANIANMQRQSQFGHLTGPAQEALSIELLRRQFGDEHPAVQNAMRQYQLNQANTQSNIDNRSFLQQTRPWGSLGKPAQENTLAVGRDIAPQLTDAQLAQHYMNGGSQEELAAMVGKTPEQARNAERKYAATNSTISSLRQAEATLAEDIVLSKFISEGLGPYARTFEGFSPAQIIDSFKKDKASVDKQARFLASRALASEQAAIRARLAGSSSASEALKDLKATSMNEFRVFRPLVSSEVFVKTQSYIDETLIQAANARFAKLRGDNISPLEPKEAMGEMVTIRNPKTGETITIPRDVYEGGKRK